MEKLPKRKHPRLKEYEYADGWYFVTLCTDKKRKILGDVETCETDVGRGALTPPQVRLSDIGKVVEKHLINTGTAYPDVKIDDYVIMPNHIHLIVAIGAAADGGVRAPRPTTLTEIVRSFKSLSTREVGYSIWQTSFYDHVIRNEADYLRIRQYMDNNPARWAEDEYFEFS